MTLIVIISSTVTIDAAASPQISLKASSALPPALLVHPLLTQLFLTRPLHYLYISTDCGRFFLLLLPVNDHDHHRGRVARGPSAPQRACCLAYFLTLPLVSAAVHSSFLPP